MNYMKSPKTLLRWPDDVNFAWPNKFFCFGIAWDVQSYHVDAKCYSLFLGPMTIRWHQR